MLGDPGGREGMDAGRDGRKVERRLLERHVRIVRSHSVPASKHARYERHWGVGDVGCCGCDMARQAVQHWPSRMIAMMCR